jgi:hypothetical protein
MSAKKRGGREAGARSTAGAAASGSRSSPWTPLGGDVPPAFASFVTRADDPNLALDGENKGNPREAGEARVGIGRRRRVSLSPSLALHQRSLR